MVLRQGVRDKNTHTGIKIAYKGQMNDDFYIRNMYLCLKSEEGKKCSIKKYPLIFTVNRILFI